MSADQKRKVDMRTKLAGDISNEGQMHTGLFVGDLLGLCEGFAVGAGLGEPEGVDVGGSVRGVAEQVGTSQ